MLHDRSGCSSAERSAKHKPSPEVDQRLRRRRQPQGRQRGSNSVREDRAQTESRASGLEPQIARRVDARLQRARLLGGTHDAAEIGVGEQIAARFPAGDAVHPAMSPLDSKPSLRSGRGTSC